jgi:hypothetical protein
MPDSIQSVARAASRRVLIRRLGHAHKQLPSHSIRLGLIATYTDPEELPLLFRCDATGFHRLHPKLAIPGSLPDDQPWELHHIIILTAAPMARHGATELACQ